MKLTNRQQEYIKRNVHRVNFTYRNKYEQYKKDHTGISRNKFVKDAIINDMSSEKDDIKLDKEVYQSFPEGMKYSSQFTISINRNTDRELYKYLLEIEETQPLADYIRLAVYKYIQEKEVVV